MFEQTLGQGVNNGYKNKGPVRLPILGPSYTRYKYLGMGLPVHKDVVTDYQPPKTPHRRIPRQCSYINKEMEITIQGETKTRLRMTT
jgi:hypothetical protein